MNLKKYLRPIFFEHDLYIGIDLGLTDFLTFSNGKVIQKPDLKRINGRIRYYQQKLSQIQFEPKHSRNRMGKTHRNDTIQSTMVWS